MNPRFKINDVVYYIHDYKIVKCKIIKIIVTKTNAGEGLTYTITSTFDDKLKELNVVEAYLVYDLNTAKQSALANWETKYRTIKTGIESLTEELYKQMEKQYLKEQKKKRK